MVKTASLYDNFCKTGNYVIYDVIIWVQDGNCKKMARENFSIGAFYNITKKLECGPMSNVMAALPNIGGALCSTPQSLADAHY